LERKKQYVQSRLHVAPEGLPRTWKEDGAFFGHVAGRFGMVSGIAYVGVNGMIFGVCI